MSASPANKKRPGAPRRPAAVVDAPADPVGDGDSPVPGPATTTVRPPAQGGGRNMGANAHRKP